MTELEASNNAVLYYGVRTMAKMNVEYAREVPDLVGGVEERADLGRVSGPAWAGTGNTFTVLSV